MRRLLVCLGMLLGLAACAAEPHWAPDDAVAKAHYVSGDPPSVTLYTVVSRETGAGGHSGLMIDGPERVLYDPAGTWYHPYSPERNDLHFGITERMRKFYIDYHARDRWDVIEQKVPVTMAQAQQIRANAEKYGAARKSYCANAISTVLKDVPGFGAIHHTWSPKKLSRYFSELPGATYRVYHDNDPENNTGVLMIQQTDPRAAEIREKAFELQDGKAAN
ncbi:hypothetical protein [Thioclava sp. GXIMD2076]|uniref:Lipoprotein n=1 Tax=Thioclava kandeliae TaxID=3070818 RepID=A0ABV1SCU2_9RHOB